MLLLIMTGNTMVKTAEWTGHGIHRLHSIETRIFRNPGLSREGSGTWDPAQLKHRGEYSGCVAVLASAEDRRHAKAMAREAGALRYFEVDHDGPLPFRVHYHEGRAGADRIANAAALRAEEMTPGIVVDFGTATTLDVVSAEGDFLGGAILPGVQTSYRALHEATGGLLPMDSLALPHSIIGHSTLEALRSGIVGGQIRAIEGLITQIRRELRAEAPVMLTGGLASAMGSGLEVSEMRTDPNFTFRGMVALWAEVGHMAAVDLGSKDF